MSPGGIQSWVLQYRDMLQGGLISAVARFTSFNLVAVPVDEMNRARSDI